MCTYLPLLLQFDGERAAWLGDEDRDDSGARLRLRWLHQLRCADYAGAAASLAQMAASQQQQQPGSEGPGGGSSTGRLLALQKLCSLAAGA